MTSSKKGISSHQIHRNLGVTYKTAWFMTHRIHEAMRDTSTDQIGGPGASGKSTDAALPLDQRHNLLLLLP